MPFLSNAFCLRHSCIDPPHSYCLDGTINTPSLPRIVLILCKSVLYTRSVYPFSPPALPRYKACPKTNKKCIDQGNGTFFSEAINEEVVPVNRYVMSTTLADHSGSSWATCFNDQVIHWEH